MRQSCASSEKTDAHSCTLRSVSDAQLDRAPCQQTVSVQQKEKAGGTHAHTHTTRTQRTNGGHVCLKESVDRSGSGRKKRRVWTIYRQAQHWLATTVCADHDTALSRTGVALVACVPARKRLHDRVCERRRKLHRRMPRARLSCDAQPPLHCAIESHVRLAS